MGKIQLGSTGIEIEKNGFGCLPVQRVSKEEAARLLRETDEKTYRVAERTGYADPNYFSYVFKRHFGLSPSKFRAGQRE